MIANVKEEVSNITRKVVLAEEEAFQCKYQCQQKEKGLFVNRLMLWSFSERFAYCNFFCIFIDVKKLLDLQRQLKTKVKDIQNQIEKNKTLVHQENKPFPIFHSFMINVQLFSNLCFLFVLTVNITVMSIKWIHIVPLWLSLSYHQTLANKFQNLKKISNPFLNKVCYACSEGRVLHFSLLGYLWRPLSRGHNKSVIRVERKRHVVAREALGFSKWWLDDYHIMMTMLMMINDASDDIM